MSASSKITHTGMANQEMPPPGGFKKLNFDRRFGRPRATGIGLILGTAALMVYGFNGVINNNKKRNLEKMEKREVRAMLVPYLQAENDEIYEYQELNRNKAESLIRKHKPDLEDIKVYNHDDTFVRPAPSKLNVDRNS